MKKIIMVILLGTFLSINSFQVTAVEGANVEVDGKIVFYSSEKESSTSSEQNTKKDAPKDTKKKGILPKTGENKNIIYVSSGAIFICLSICLVVLKREGGLYENKK